MSFTVYAGSSILGGAASTASFRNTVSPESGPSTVTGPRRSPPDISARKGPLAAAVPTTSIAPDTTARADRTAVVRMMNTSTNHTTGGAMWFHAGRNRWGATGV